MAAALLACTLVWPAQAQAQAPAAVGAPAAGAAAEPKIEAVAAADIAARADEDERFVQAVMQRAQDNTAAQQFERELARHATAAQATAAQASADELAALPVPRLQSLHRHWQLNEHELDRSRAALARATQASSADAAGLTRRHAAWRATREAGAGVAPALMQRVDELITRIDGAEDALSAPLGRLIALGRRGSALSAQQQAQQALVTGQLADRDRRLLVMDAAPLWQAGAAADTSAPATGADGLVGGMDGGLAIERSLARDHDAANVRMARVLLVGCALLLPLLLWLNRRTKLLVAEGAASTAPADVLLRPWAAWLVLVALAVAMYDLQGPTIRQQAVLLLAWVPVLRLLPKPVLAMLGPWAYLSAVFYLLNLVLSLLTGHTLAYRWLLLGLDVLMLASLGWLIHRSHGAAAAGQVQRPVAARLRWVAFAITSVAALSNVMGNVTLATMLTGALLDSSYAALALYAGATVLVVLWRVLLEGTKASQLTNRHVGSMVRAAGHMGQTLVTLAWMVITLQAFRVYRPLVDGLVAVLVHEYKLGVVSISLGSIVAFVAAAWVAFWLARTIRLLLAEDILPAMALPRGVGNSISTLTYYSVLFIGLLVALAVAGYPVSQLAIVFGALGVGIGFGLQDIVKNFVSGLILMIERPIQPGDLVEVAGMMGGVREIGMRATTVGTFDGAVVVVPNGMLLADKLVNWSLDGQRRRFEVNICTGFDTPPQQTLALLVKLAGGIEGLAAQPAPEAILTGFASGTLEFTLRVWTVDRADWTQVRSTLSVAVRDGLAAAGIQVPLPQREMHVRSDSSQLAGPAAAGPPGLIKPAPDQRGA